MDSSLKRACFDEITHLICDADKKVNFVFFVKFSIKMDCPSFKG